MDLNYAVWAIVMMAWCTSFDVYVLLSKADYIRRVGWSLFAVVPAAGFILRILTTYSWTGFVEAPFYWARAYGILGMVAAIAFVLVVCFAHILLAINILVLVFIVRPGDALERNDVLDSRLREYMSSCRLQAAQEKRRVEALDMLDAQRGRRTRRLNRLADPDGARAMVNEVLARAREAPAAHEQDLPPGMQTSRNQRDTYNGAHRVGEGIPLNGAVWRTKGPNRGHYPSPSTG